MLNRFLIAAVILLAACQSAAPTETSIKTPAAPSSTETPIPHWLETEMNGVSLGMWRPDGWETDLNNGLLMVEHTVSSSGGVEGGMVVYVFVPPTDGFDVQTNASNFAWAVLDQIVKMPSYTGWDLAVSQPAGFEWDQHPPAYYLLTTGDGVRSMVLALALPNQSKVVVCNIGVPAGQAYRIRALLPQLLDGLTINGSIMHGDGLDSLPNPLPFPRYNLVSGSVDTRMPPHSPP